MRSLRPGLFASFATFGWAPNPAADGTDQPRRILDQNFRTAIADEMRRRGYTQAAENLDLRIAYETTSATQIEGSLEAPAVTAAVQAAMRDFPTRQSSD
jgi:hypothetical protein